MASIDKRPNGRYRARWREFPGGPQKTRHFDRKRDAERFLVDVEHRQLSGTYVGPEASRVTLGEYLDTFLTRQPWRRSTTVLVTNALAHVRPKLGGHPIGSIRKGDVQALVTRLAAGDGDKGALKPGTVTTSLRWLRAALESAVDDGLIVRNPAAGVRPPGRDAGEIVPPTVKDVAAVYEACADWLRPAVMLGAGLGLRQGEATGLTVDRVDWLGRSVRIDRQWLSRHGLAEFGPPKTAASVRTVPASDVVIAELSAHVGQRHEGFVLLRNDRPVNYNDFGYHWRRAVAAAGVAPLRFHDLRHAYASMLISAGCSVKAVSKALGHASAAMTLNLYSHLWPGDEDRIRQAVDLALAHRAEDSVRTGEGTS